jgi:uncharacterized membrane-anchored protein YjiN (DUF445 family)
MAVLYTDPGFEQKIRDIVKKVPTVEEFRRITKLVECSPSEVQAKVLNNRSIELHVVIAATLVSMFKKGEITKDNFPRYDELAQAINNKQVTKFVSNFSKELGEIMKNHIIGHQEAGDN